MNVASPLEIPLTVLGWLSYGTIWRVLQETGIAWLPFLFLLARAWSHAREKMDEDEAAMTTLRVLENRSIVMFSVVVLAAQPTLTLSIDGLNFSRQDCNSGVTTAATVRGGATGTTFDRVFTATTLGGAAAKVPIWWYGAMAISGGITNAAIVGLPCSPDLRGMAYRLNLNPLNRDPDLRRETRWFYQDCFRRAMQRLQVRRHSGLILPAGTRAADVEWLGSPFFLGAAGFYGDLYADRPVPGFAVDPNRLPDMHALAALGPGGLAWGYPNCREWWNGTAGMEGLRVRLTRHYTQPDPDNYDNVLTALGQPHRRLLLQNLTSLDTSSVVLRGLLNNDRMALYDIARAARDSGYREGIGDWLSNAAAKVGSVKTRYLDGYYPMMLMIREATRNIQAVLLMAVYMLLPFVMLFSEYSFTKLMMATVGVFAIKFMGFLWAVAYWLDTHLLDSMNSLNLAIGFYDDNDVSRDVVGFVIGGTYLGLPFLWLTLLGWAGWNVGSELGNLGGNLTHEASKAGSAGGAMAGSAATAAAKTSRKP